MLVPNFRENWNHGGEESHIENTANMFTVLLVNVQTGNSGPFTENVLFEYGMIN